MGGRNLRVQVRVMIADCSAGLCVKQCRWAFKVDFLMCLDPSNCFQRPRCAQARFPKSCVCRVEVQRHSVGMFAPTYDHSHAIRVDFARVVVVV